MTGSEYATKTQGTSHVPPVTPLAEGVYAITSTGRESHIAYNITIPQELGEVQKDLGIQERGSFVTSVKNPNKPAPAGASLPKGPDYPQELLDEFRSLRWKPLEPKYLDYQNTQFLLIGESHHYDKAVEQRPKDERQGNAPPEEEMEKLEGENEIRIKHLKGTSHSCCPSSDQPLTNSYRGRFSICGSRHHSQGLPQGPDDLVIAVLSSCCMKRIGWPTWGLRCCMVIRWSIPW